MAKILSFSLKQKSSEQESLYTNWVEYFKTIPHEDLLDLLVYEHENDFPMKNSAMLIEKMKHKALVSVLDDQAQTTFLKNFLKEFAE